MNKIELDDYDLHDGTLKTGKLQFDTGVIYRKSTFQLIDFSSLVASRGKRSLKVANRLDFLHPNTGRLFHLFVSTPDAL